MIENIPLEQQSNKDKMPIDIPSAQMPQNPMLCDAISSVMSNYDNNSDVRKAFDNLWNQQN
jgi:hypothetical protein